MSAPEEIARLRALCDGATPGPWYRQVNDLIGGACVMRTDEPPSTGGPEIADFTNPADADLITEARDALPATLACLTELLALEDATLTCSNNHDERWCGYCENRRDAFAEVAGIIARHFPGEQA